MKMKINRTIALIAIIYNLINFLFLWHIKGMPDATSMIYLLIYPCFWIITLVLVTIISIKKRIIWFRQDYRISTIISLFFCTPIFFLIIARAELPESYCQSSGYTSKNGYTFKYEEWVYNPNHVQVVKYWKANKENCNSCDTSQFKKDSTWVYFDKKQDTIKTEVYKNGNLISIKKNK